MSVVVSKCCCSPGPDNCVPVWKWENDECPDSVSATSIFATGPQWEALVPDCAASGTQHVIFDYTGATPTYALNSSSDGTGTNLGEMFTFNGGHDSLGSVARNTPPIGELGCGKLDFIGYICDKSGQDFCNPDNSDGDGSNCICTRESLALSDCSSLSSGSFPSYNVSDWKIIGYGTEPTGFDRSGYTPVTSAAGNKIWLGRGWYNNSGWDLSTGSLGFPKSLCAADDCCDDECLSDTPTCAEWLEANPPAIEFVLNRLPLAWRACYTSPSDCRQHLFWEIEVENFTYTLNGRYLTDLRMEIKVTVNGSGWADNCQGGIQPEFPGPVSRQLTICADPGYLPNIADFCGTSDDSLNLKLSGYNYCYTDAEVPLAEWCGFDFAGTTVWTQKLFAGISVNRTNVTGYSTPWPPPYGQTTNYPVEWSLQTTNPQHPIDKDCDGIGFPSDPCHLWDTNQDDNLFGYFAIKMPPAPPEC